MSRAFAPAQHFQHLVSSASWLQRVTRLQRGRQRTSAAHAIPEVRRRPKPGPHVQKQAAPATTLSETSALLLEAAKKKGAPLVVLQKGKARLFWEGAPMVYSGAVERVDADMPPTTGSLVVLTDANLVPLGWGVYNSESMYRLRVLQWCEESSGSTLLELGPLLHQRVLAAVSLRAALGLPSAATTVYRLINSEGDRLSGLTVDVYGSVLVAAYSAAWVELNRPAVEAALREATGVSHILWRPQRELLKLEGLLMDETEGNKDDATLSRETEPSSQPSHVRVQENSVCFKVNLRHGQKTGFYTDQRDSRELIRSLSTGKSVLDLCCYTGGFALNAAAGGAANVTGVDSSLAAVSLAKENASLSRETAHATFVASAVESFMQDAASSGQRWDTVILDPPKLAPKKRDLLRATPKYRKLNVAALRLVKPGGLLMTCSCSGAVAQGTGLLPIVKEAAQVAGRRVSLLRHAGAAMDHPLDPGYPEGQYLTNLLLRVA